jgi:hypothetical protein
MRRPFLRFLAVTMTAANLSACTLSPVVAPAGGVAGMIEWAGKPAPGRMVTLYTSTDGGATFIDTKQTAVSDRNGVYAFNGLQPGTYSVLYVADALPGSNEFLWWRSATAGVGQAIPTFDVAYNDVIYPSVSAAIASPVLVTLFWSSSRFGNRYRVSLYSAPNGVNVDTSNPTWRSDWVTELCGTATQTAGGANSAECQTMVIPQNLQPGNYSWGVEVDGGERGFGSSKLRSLILNAPS